LKQLLELVLGYFPSLYTKNGKTFKNCFENKKMIRENEITFFSVT